MAKQTATRVVIRESWRQDANRAHDIRIWAINKNIIPAGGTLMVVAKPQIQLNEPPPSFYPDIILPFRPSLRRAEVE
jgi:hypothetical protein